MLVTFKTRIEHMLVKMRGEKGMNDRNGKGYHDPTAYKATQERKRNPKAQFRGAQNKAAGSFFEKLIEASCTNYQRKGIAVIEKTPEPVRFATSLGNGKFIAYPEKMAQPDFKGVLKGGQAVVFEVKHTEKDFIGYERVNTEQSRSLTNYKAAGAVCFVLVSLQMKRFFRVPWGVWNDMKGIFGRKHMKEADMREFEIKLKGGYLDFLEEVDSIEQQENEFVRDI